jgi:anhydro-N-acetylmuramic acid kinase
MKTYRVIGLMSGSSLDGLDIAYCEFKGEKQTWTYDILTTSYVPYPTRWRLRLANLTLQNAITYMKTHAFFGHYLGELVSDFVSEQKIDDEVDFIASHGQTIFHQPENKMTSQIGDGAAIAAVTGLPVVYDFRLADVAHGGQGAPIVPIGDRILFHDYSHCLNLGGIANISFKAPGNRMVGYDICSVNGLLNALSEELELPYDDNGNISASGEISAGLLEDMNSSWYFEKEYPKSLNGGWLMKMLMPMVKRANLPTKDKLATACEHIAIQIGREVNRIYLNEHVDRADAHQMLVTGGGAFNGYLVQRIRHHCPIPVDVPNEELIKFKEAIVMGLIGVLRVENQVNCLADVTGATRDTIGGVIHQGTSKLL